MTTLVSADGAFQWNGRRWKAVTNAEGELTPWSPAEAANVTELNTSPGYQASSILTESEEAVLEGAAENGAETRLVNLRELKINGCLGCEGCKKHPGKCVQKDDLTILLQDMTAYDAIVMGTPVYWYHVSAQFKMLVDRLYCFFEFGENLFQPWLKW